MLENPLWDFRNEDLYNDLVWQREGGWARKQAVETAEEVDMNGFMVVVVVSESQRILVRNGSRLVVLFHYLKLH
ncbi:hypothetical protein Lal_00007941 [Lupinus albus]|nr:hypothetical protein Lal_00007941 [Lupinus albus]